MLLSSALFRRTVFDKIGLFDESLEYFTDDMDWFLRAREVGARIKILQEVTLVWRIHDRNTSREQSIRDRALTEVVKRSLDRRRAQNEGSAVPLPKFTDFVERPESGPGREAEERASLGPSGATCRPRKAGAF
jgi:hypothetical protein